MAAPTTGYFPKTGDDLVDAMTTGYRWNLTSDRTIDFAVANGFSGEYWNNIHSVNSYMSDAINLFSYYANVKFNNVGLFLNPSAAFNGGSEITLSLDGSGYMSPSTWAIGFFPDSRYNQSFYNGAPGDLFLNINSAANYLPSYEPGSQGWFLLLHELGHTLGLKHPHDDGGTGRPTFGQLRMGSLDVDLATIMSYNDDGSWNDFSWDPATPMILDVYALQYLYGKNNSTNSGDSVFTLVNDGYYKTIWDASGSDTIDLSSNYSGWTIYLPNESWSNLVDTKAGFALPTYDYSLTVPTNLNWLAGDFENVIGSNYSDIIYGNLFSNRINGLNGNDSIEAGYGFDTIYGGLGSDYIQGGFNGDQIFGEEGNDDLRGGNGLDLIVGGVGNDTIRGAKGTDTLTGGEGADVFIFHTDLDGTINVDTITDFVSGVDRIELSASIFTAFANQIGSTVGIGQNLIYNQSTGVLSYDADGAGFVSPLAFAIIGTASHPLMGNDFLIAA